MTGFGAAEAQNDNYTVEVEVKTLNSKFLDLSLKFPRVLNTKEIEIRNIINDELIRGKVSVSIKLNQKNVQATLPEINQTLFKTYVAQYTALEESTGRNFHDLMKMALEAPEVIAYQEEQLTDTDYECVINCLKDAIAQCNSFRESEGKTVGSLLSGYIAAINEKLKRAIEIEPQRMIKIRERLQNNIKEITQSVEFNAERLEQELIFYSEKLDVNEEIERLRIHLKYFQDTLNSKETSHGKKLGFISQEIGREINTLGSKANDSLLQEQVIQMKEELEKIKEQSLNVL